MRSKINLIFAALLLSVPSTPCLGQHIYAPHLRLTPEKVKEVLLRNTSRTEFFPYQIPSIDTVLARAISEFSGDHLRLYCPAIDNRALQILATTAADTMELPKFNRFDDSVLLALSGFSGSSLRLGSIGSMTDELGKKLIESKLPARFNSIDSMSVRLAKAIAKDVIYGVRVYCPESLEVVDAKAIVQCKMHRLRISGLQTLEKYIAQILSGAQSKILAIDDVLTVSDVSLQALCEFVPAGFELPDSSSIFFPVVKAMWNQYGLRLNNIRSLSDRQADIIATSNVVTIFLPSVTILSDYQARSLARFPGLRIVLSGLEQESRERFNKYRTAWLESNTSGGD